MSVTIKIVTRPLSTMGVNTCTLESMVSYHYPPRTKDKTRQDILVIYVYVICFVSAVDGARYYG